MLRSLSYLIEHDKSVYTIKIWKRLFDNQLNPTKLLTNYTKEVINCEFKIDMPN